MDGYLGTGIPCPTVGSCTSVRTCTVYPRWCTERCVYVRNCHLLRLGRQGVGQLHRIDRLDTTVGQRTANVKCRLAHEMTDKKSLREILSLNIYY